MSAPRIDRALVLHVARLSSLSLSDDQADRLTGELARIVGYVEQLAELDTRDVVPFASAVAAPRATLPRAPWREDEVKPGLSHEDALAQAPSVERGGFSVPAFVE